MYIYIQIANGLVSTMSVKNPSGLISGDRSSGLLIGRQHCVAEVRRKSFTSERGTGKCYSVSILYPAEKIMRHRK